MNFLYSKIFRYSFLGILILASGLIAQKIGWLESVQYGILQAPRPIVAATRFVFEPVRTAAVTLFSMRAIVRENVSLQTQVNELNLIKAEKERLATENELLRSELKFKAKSPHLLESCNVLSIDPQEVSDTMLLSCGISSGIKEGQGVVSSGYLIAKIIHVGEYTSTALLVTNGQSSIDAKSSRSGVEGVVKGSFGSGMVLDLISQHADINSGDLIVTAGINGKIPKDIVIGQAGQLVSGPNDLFKKLSVASPIRLRSLDYVFVIK